MLLFQDTETTGLLDYKKDLLDFSQPRICALAASLTDQDGNIIDEMDVLIKPDGWEIEPGAAAVNGLTVEKCDAEGIPMKDALLRYFELKAQCKARVGANVSYDKRMILRETRIASLPHESEGLDSICILTMAAPYLKSRKRSNLAVTYQEIIGEEMQNAHTGMGDVRACQAVYFELMRRMRGEAA